MTVGLFFVPAAGAPAAVIATLAGSGALGRADGAASSATFMLPYGVAVGPDGTIFVTDYLAQSVRAIAKDGTVRTVAGGGKLIENGMKVQGGYADGPALQARFNGPTGIAVDASGRIFVADSANACIRVIESGSVRTFAGSPSRRAKVDGPIGGAGFWAPRAL
jgi:DNA-binding beta-propeller fold protein YncE